MDLKELKEQLEGLKLQLDIQMAVVKFESQKMDISPSNMVYHDGAHVLPPLLLAKSNVLLALSNLVKIES